MAAWIEYLTAVNNLLTGAKTVYEGSKTAKRAYDFGKEKVLALPSGVTWPKVEPFRKMPKSNGKKRKASATKVNARQGGTKSKLKNKKKSKKKLSKGQSLKRDVKRLKKAVLTKPFATFIYKQAIVSQSLVSPNNVAYKDITFWDPATVEAAIDATPYQTFSSPSTTSTVNLTQAVKHQKIPMKVYGKIMLKNNHNMPINMDYYIYEPKNDVDLSSSSIVYEMAVDFGKAGVTNTTPPQAATDNPVLYPSDSPFWRANVKVMEHKSLRLEPGDELNITQSDAFTYDQEWTDEHATTWTRKYTRAIMFRITGVPAHDETTTTNVGLGDGGYDVVLHRRYEITTPSDIKTLNYEVSNSYDALTTPTITGPDTGTEKEDQ